VKAKAIEHVGDRAIVLLGVGVALLALTGLSFGLAHLNLGSAALPVAFTIAIVKSVLIALFFMHLLEQRASNALVFGTAIFFLVLMVVFILLETGTRFRPSIPPGPFGTTDQL
jgi:cytochrome c oxidase subunit 4